MSSFRIGYGYDIHRLQPGGRMILGGVQVSTEISPIAYSDGDVVIHAIVDALLGSLGMGDIGEHYSDKDPRWKGAGSQVFLNETMQRVEDAGFVIGNVDITIMAERPRLSGFKPKMRDSLRSMLTPGAIINIKAGTNEQCDAIGRGEAIAAHAVVLLAAKA